MDVGGNAAHHVVAGRDHRDRRNDRVDVGEGLGQFADAGQAAVQDFLAEVVEFQQHVVLVRAHAVAGQDFLDHGTGDHVATGQVLRVRRITLHEALAVGVDQVTAFAAATFGDQYTGAAMPVGWNCHISMSCTGTPARRAMPTPSPVLISALVVEA